MPRSGVEKRSNSLDTRRTAPSPVPDVPPDEVSLASLDLGEGTVSVAGVTFTPLNWSTPQIVTVTGVDDFLAQGKTHDELCNQVVAKLPLDLRAATYRLLVSNTESFSGATSDGGGACQLDEVSGAQRISGKDGFSTACGHGTIALGAWAVETGSGTTVAPFEPPNDLTLQAARLKFELLPNGRTWRFFLRKGVTFKTAADVVAFVKAKMLVETLAGDFDPSELEDDYAEAVEAVVKAKIEGGEVKRTKEPAPSAGEVVDLLAAQVYAGYIHEQGGTYLRADFANAEEPMMHLRRLLGLDGITADGGAKHGDLERSGVVGVAQEHVERRGVATVAATGQGHVDLRWV